MAIPMEQCHHVPGRYALCLAAPIVALLWLFFETPHLMADDGSIPRSGLPGVASLDQVEHWDLPWVDVEALRAEDSKRESSGLPVAPRFAKNIPVAFTPDNSGTWETLEDSSRVWRLHVTSAGALSLSLGLKTFDLPEGAKFWIHAPNGSGVQGPYTRQNRNALGGLWTAVVLGDEIVVELHLPKDAGADVLIESVNHGYRLFGERETYIDLSRGSCHINVVCTQGDPWRDQIRSVARIITSDGWYQYGCTGHLVNNTAEDLRPYLLTAEHCVESEGMAATMVAYWNYESPECDDFAGGNLSQNQSGSTLRASWSYSGGTDFALVELDDDPQPSFNVFYTGWDARDQIPGSTTTIHHPDADEKSITLDYDSPIITFRGGTVTSEDGLYLTVLDWDEGTTEAGSSGSCLFDDVTKRCVGNLSGGLAACGNNLDDWFGRFHSHWTGGGTVETRLSDWLDPSNTGALYVNGFDPLIFVDGFESGETSKWSSAVP
jgi:hypothetical protein